MRWRVAHALLPRSWRTEGEEGVGRWNLLLRVRIVVALVVVVAVASAVGTAVVAAVTTRFAINSKLGDQPPIGVESTVAAVEVEVEVAIPVAVALVVAVGAAVGAFAMYTYISRRLAIDSGPAGEPPTGVESIVAVVAVAVVAAAVVAAAVAAAGTSAVGTTRRSVVAAVTKRRATDPKPGDQPPIGVESTVAAMAVGVAVLEVQKWMSPET